MNFTEDIKEVKEFSQRFKYGVHYVEITGIDLNSTDEDKEFIEFEVKGENGEEDKARLWFSTPKGANYSFNVARQIYVHNAPQAQKQTAATNVDKTKNTEELANLLQKLVGKNCWFTVYPSPDRTYTDNQGEIRASIDKNVLGYEPKLRLDLIPKEERVEAITGGEEVDIQDVPFEDPVKKEDDTNTTTNKSTIPEKF